MLKDLSITVAIPTFNRNEDLFRCLGSLRRQTDTDFDIVICNGGTPEGVRRIAEQFEGLRIKIVDQQKKGIVEGRNLGWRHANSDIVCFIDDDLAVSPEWLVNIRKTFLSEDKIGGVSGPTLIPQERLKNRDFALLLEQFKTSKNILFRIFGRIYINLILENKVHEVGRILDSGAFTPGSNFRECLNLPASVEVDYLEACHMCFRRFLLEKIGGFDYAYLGTGEWNEPDFSFKVRKLGYKLVFNPKAVTEHHISQSGVFKARTNAYERSWNFIYFYFNNVKPDNFRKIIRFCANLFFINGYWFYKFLQSGNLDWLRGLEGSIVGLFFATRKNT